MQISPNFLRFCPHSGTQLATHCRNDLGLSMYQYRRMVRSDGLVFQLAHYLWVALQMTPTAILKPYMSQNFQSCGASQLPILFLYFSIITFIHFEIRQSTIHNSFYAFTAMQITDFDWIGVRTVYSELLFILSESSSYDLNRQSEGILVLREATVFLLFPSQDRYLF